MDIKNKQVETKTAFINWLALNFMFSVLLILLLAVGLSVFW